MSPLRHSLRTFARAVPHPYVFLAGRDALLVGTNTPLRLPLDRLGRALASPAAEAGIPVRVRRVQVLFRPEDVALARSAETLGCPQFGQGEVEQSTFSGSFERLRLRSSTPRVSLAPRMMW